MPDEPIQPIPGPPRRSPRRVWVYPLVTVFAWGAGLALFFRFFDAFRFIFLTALFAGCLAAALKPVREKIPGPRWFAGAITGLIPIIIGLGIFYLIGWLIAGPITEEMAQWPAMKQNLDQLLAHLSNWLRLGQPITVDQLVQRAEHRFFGEGSGMASAASTVLTIAVILITVGIGSLYMQAEPPMRIVNPVLAMLPLHRRAAFQHAFDDLVPRLRWWLIGTIIDIIVIGGISWLFFWLGGVPLPIPLAVLAGLSEIVPTIGPAIAFVIALLFAAAKGTSTVLVVLGAYAGVHIIEAYVLMPLVMKRAVMVPPIITLFTVLFWSEVFGIPGLLLSLPINLFLWGFIDHFLVRRYEKASQRPPQSLTG